MKKNQKKKWIWIGTGAIILIIVSVILFAGSKKKNQNGPKTVKVERKTIVDKALAVGAIEPMNEIAVKSKISGVVRKMYVEVGDFVNAGDPLLEIKPDPTPLELAEAKRNVEMTNIAVKNTQRELERGNDLKGKNLISDYDYEQLKKVYDETILNKKMAEERLELIEKGKIKIENTQIESVVKAPISGFILEKSVNAGDPVVPLTSYQAGTELMKMANMDMLLFKGSVDEIDVGKIAEDMTADLEVGALPGKKVTGKVRLISLKAQKEDNSTVFPIEIDIVDTGDATLRAGYSANAHIIIAQKDSVLSLPERVVTFRNDSAFVRVAEGEAGSKEVCIKTGLSDAIQIELKSGLNEGDEVLEKEALVIK